MKKKHKSNSLESLMKKAKPALCPGCGGKLWLFSISCGLDPCYYEYICIKCYREIDMTAEDGIVRNEKIGREGLIKKLKDLGKRIIIFSSRKTISWEIKLEASEYNYLEDIKDKIARK